MSKKKPRGIVPQKSYKKLPLQKAKTLKKDPKTIPLSEEQSFLSCSTELFDHSNSHDYKLSHEIIAQDRAVSAIHMGLGIRKPGYNIYVAGIQGTGKTSVIRSFLETWSSHSPSPADWIYVYDFNDPEVPKAIHLKGGDGKRLKKSMENLVKTLKEVIPAALQSEDYENAVNAYLSASNERKSKQYAELEKLAKSMDFVIKSTRMGIETIPVVDGRPLSEKEYSKLGDRLRETIEDKRTQLEPEVLDFARKVRAIEQETNQYVESIRNELGQTLVGREMDPIIQSFSENDAIKSYLDDVKKHVLENLLDFVEDENSSRESKDEIFFSPENRDKFRKYKINVFVDNTNLSRAPVIIETNPTYYNLFGRIEKNVEHGMYLTDFTMIKAGAIHRANGGYLVLNAMDVFKTNGIWDTLKRVLKNRLGFIEDMGEQFSLLPTSGLRPTPIPLDVKVIMIGNDEVYHLLFDADEDFHKIFKIKSDFDFRMPRTKETINAYASFVATRVKVENLLNFDREGVAAIVEYGSRLVEDQRFLSTQFSEIKDLTIEADYIARQANQATVTREHVEKALDLKFERLNLAEEHLISMVKNRDILLSIEGAQVGQVNGLSVYDLGDYSFGKISRITCSISLTNEGVINIERSSKLSGKIHDKGVHILSSFLNAVLAHEKGLGITASICFEQSYGLIDGDSATVTELIAILSALSHIPVRQNVAMTGSLNQFGDIQPIGGVNEKIEGFWRSVQSIDPNQEVTVLIPKQNSQNLMLHRSIRMAIRSGKLTIFPITSISDAFYLATGHNLGYQGILCRDFPINSALDQINKRLLKIHPARKMKRR